MTRTFPLLAEEGCRRRRRGGAYSRSRSSAARSGRITCGRMPRSPMPTRKATGWKVAEPQDESNRGNWWEIFGDPQLFRADRKHQHIEPERAPGEAQFRQAQAVAAQSRAALFPTLDRERLDHSQPLADGLGRGHDRGAHHQTTAPWASAHRGNSTSGRPAPRARVERGGRAGERGRSRGGAPLGGRPSSLPTIFSCVSSTRRSSCSTITATAFDKSLELTRNRYTAGVAAKVDLAQAETQLKSTQAQAIDTGVQRAQLEHAIAILIGKPPSEFSLAAVPLAVTMPRVPLGLPSELLERRPDVARPSAAPPRRTRGSAWPRPRTFRPLTLSGNTGFRSAAATDLFTASSRFWSIGRGARAVDLRRGAAPRADRAGDRRLRRDRRRIPPSRARRFFRKSRTTSRRCASLGEEAEVQEGAVARRARISLAYDQPIQSRHRELYQRGHGADHAAQHERTAVGILAGGWLRP